MYVPNDVILWQWDFSEPIEKNGTIITLYQRELFKKIPRLGTFCTQSVIEKLNRA
jgi:hypothetical protein